MDLETIERILGTPRTCRVCDGTGDIPVNTCPACKGYSRFKDFQCWMCQGLGVLLDACPECGGMGSVWE